MPWEAPLTLNKPAFCHLPLPGPIPWGPMAQSVSKNTRLGQTRAGALSVRAGSLSLGCLQGASFGCPGIQFPSLEWAPSWLPLTPGPAPSQQGRKQRKGSQRSCPSRAAGMGEQWAVGASAGHSTGDPKRQDTKPSPRVVGDKLTKVALHKQNTA